MKFVPGIHSLDGVPTNDPYHDFCRLSRQMDKEIIFLGGKDYVPPILLHHLNFRKQENTLFQLDASSRCTRMCVETVSNVHQDKLPL